MYRSTSRRISLGRDEELHEEPAGPRAASDRGGLYEAIRPAREHRLEAAGGFFPGSTIGNFEPVEAHAFLRHAATLLGRGAVLLIGVDLIKAPAILNAAYTDAAGVTAAST